MRAGRAVRSALRALAAQRLRALLAVVSVAAGVAALSLTRAIGEGAQAELGRSLDAMGADLLVVRPAAVPRRPARPELRGLATSLDLDDHAALAALPVVTGAVPCASASLQVRGGGSAMLATVEGTTPAFPAARRFAVASGRFLDDDDDTGLRRVAVLGARVAERLFPGQVATGETVRIRGAPFEVVGVLAGKGVLADGSDEDRLVLVPLRTALRRVLNVTWLDAVFVSVRGTTARAEVELRALLRERHRLAPGRADDFTIQDRARALAARQETVGWLALLTTGLAGLALLVGGAGVLAVMLLGVRERTAEIGLRVAVGARPRDVVAQLLLEATALALGGWALGLALGALGAGAVALATDWPVRASVASALESLVVTLVTGVAAGSLPARRASLVPPIQALHDRVP